MTSSTNNPLYKGWESLFQSLQEELEQIRQQEPKLLNQAKASIHACLAKIEALRKDVNEKGLPTIENEIYFFKEVKPWFVGQLIFFQEMYRTELTIPIGGVDEKLEFLKERLRKLLDFFDEHSHIYRYIRSDATYLDSVYFVRHSSTETPDIEEVDPDRDLSFTSRLDGYLSRIIANDLCSEFLAERIADFIKEKTQPIATLGGPLPKLEWTGKRAELYELIYGIKVSKVVNNGKASINQLASAFEAFFNINLRNIYRGQQENRIKKKRNAFLHGMAQLADEDMDNLDENPRFK